MNAKILIAICVCACLVDAVASIALPPAHLSFEQDEEALHERKRRDTLIDFEEAPAPEQPAPLAADGKVVALFPFDEEPYVPERSLGFHNARHDLHHFHKLGF